MNRALYPYVDFQFSKGEMNSQWMRVHVSKLDELLNSHKDSNCFNTIQFFKSDVNEEGGLQFVPIYFDLDYKDDVGVALVDARALVDFFGRMGIGQEHIRIWFSGSKGFHLVITPELFGVKPHTELTYIIKNACTYVASQLNLRSFDSRVYSIRRMWRMPDSMHLKTDLYCTELYHHELEYDIDKIRETARGVNVPVDGENNYVPRGALYEESEYENVESNPLCATWFSAFVGDYETQKELQNLRPKNTIRILPGEHPVCITDLLTESIRKPGTRNQGEMALVSYYKDVGVDDKTAYQTVRDWAGRIPPNMTSKTDKRSLDADVKGVVKTVYDSEHGDRYHFACHYIRALGVGTEKPIKCLYDKCKFVSQEDQEPEKTIDLKLPQATRAVYIGKRVRTEIMVAGKDDAPYGVPTHIKVKCRPDLTVERSICHSCPIAQYGGDYSFKFNARSKHILRLIDTTDQNQKQYLRSKVGIPPKCNRHFFDILEYSNVIEIMGIPRIAFTPDSVTSEDSYVTRKCYFVGHDIEPNKEYVIEEYGYPDPKTQLMVHVIESATPLTDDVQQFTPNQEVLERLRIFQIESQQVYEVKK